MSGRRGGLAELALLFGRLSLTAFGGPAAHIALIRDEVVRRRGWLTDNELLELIAASNLIPGPTSTELAMHVGHRRRGVPGLVVAGIAFIVPASLVVAVLAWAYLAFGARPEAAVVLATIAPTVVAVLVGAAVDLGRSISRDPLRVAIAAVACVAALVGVSEVAVLLGGGLVALVARTAIRPRGMVALPVLTALAAASVTAATLPGLALAFLKIGALLFGSGYVLVAFLRSELVEGLGWLTERQLLDAVAVGQVTPGPLFTTATLVGWVVLGPAGALVATVAIFLPGFLFVLASVPVLERLRASARATAILDGVGAAALGLIVAVAAQLARAAIVTPVDALIAIVAGVLIVTRLLGPGTVVLLAAAAGLARAVVPG